MVQPSVDGPAASASEADDTEQELSLLDDEERLPWLESDDDYEPAGANTGRIIAFAAVGLIVVGLIVGGLWWLTSDRTDSELVADGSIIEAPDEPYRTAPEDPGGTEVAGTGDTSFEVAEGQTVDARIAGSGNVAASAAPNAPVATPAPAAAPPTTKMEPVKPAPTGVGVQVGAYSSRTAAEAGWQQLSGRISVLQGRSHRVVQGVADSGTIFRLQALAGSAAEADTLCRSIKSEGGDCQVKR